ncbi:hypothetical protein FJO69_01555 [[Mycoplasma] falconis]|uniref:DUF4064 domain-containing protein n=1 Tax=[Mycoplasma] falconis TaxID=92403 RepID=A0A501XA70_9BACT|nr:hypothetical protein [[Mycoplasma] falconis]TPE57420.1 hypothetical protein FJO69_01555 [[Mycoplasma] falconis]
MENLQRQYKRARGAMITNILAIIFGVLTLIVLSLLQLFVYKSVANQPKNTESTEANEQNTKILVASITVFILNLAFFGGAFAVFITNLVFTALAASSKLDEKARTFKVLLWVGFGLTFVMYIIGPVIALIGAVQLKLHIKELMKKTPSEPQEEVITTEK